MKIFAEKILLIHALQNIEYLSIPIDEASTITSSRVRFFRFVFPSFVTSMNSCMHITIFIQCSLIWT